MSNPRQSAKLGQVSSSSSASSTDESKPAWLRRIDKRMDFVHETAMRLQAWAAEHGAPPLSAADVEREAEEE
jgi:hypothetical protein